MSQQTEIDFEQMVNQIRGRTPSCSKASGSGWQRAHSSKRRSASTREASRFSPIITWPSPQARASAEGAHKAPTQCALHRFQEPRKCRPCQYRTDCRQSPRTHGPDSGVRPRSSPSKHVEVFHRTLKSGCRIEDHRLAIDLVVAWRVMWLRASSGARPRRCPARCSSRKPSGKPCIAITTAHPIRPRHRQPSARRCTCWPSSAASSGASVTAIRGRSHSGADWRDCPISPIRFRSFIPRSRPDRNAVCSMWEIDSEDDRSAKPLS